MNYYLSEYNMISRTPMYLVMFKFAIEHVSRVSRVLQQDNGHLLLVGIGGSGRHSVVKLAASMAEFALFEVQYNRKVVLHISILMYRNIRLKYLGITDYQNGETT